MSESLYDYAERLEIALSEGSQFAAYNKDMRHASVVVCLAFEYAQDRILLLSNKLDPALYGSDWFMESARKFLGEEAGRLDILVESDLPSDHPMAELAVEYRDQVTIKRVPERLLDEYGYNYMVVDAKGYRFERDRSKPEAVVFFNGEDENHGEFVERLRGVFKMLSSRSTPVAVPLAPA